MTKCQEVAPTESNFVGVIFVYSYMEYIDNSHKIRIEWTILRGTSKVREDFSRAKLALILLGPDWRYQLSPDIVDVEKGVIKTEIPAGLPEGVYGIKAIWIKDDHHPCEGRHFIHPKHPPVPPAHHPVPVGPHFYPYAGMWHKGYIPAPLDIHINSGKLAQARKDDLFGVTELVPECEHPGNTIVIKISSSVATYGYDGLDAYELAVLHGETMTEEEWLAGQSGGVRTRVWDNLETDSGEDALSARQGMVLKGMIDDIWAKINECCGKMASITLTPIAEGLVSELGGDVVFTYEVMGGINRVVVDSGSIGHTHDATNRTITLHIPANTDSLDRKTFTLTVTGMATTMDGDEVQVAEARATAQQAGHTPVVTSWRVGNITFTYGSIPATGGIVSVDTLIIPIIRTYDIALRSGSNEDTLYYEHGKSGNTYTPSLRFSKVEKQGSEISFTVSDELEGELNVAERDNPEGATDEDVVRVGYSFNGVGSLPALQGYALADLTQMAADAHATGRYSNLEITKFEYPNNLLWNDGDWKSPTIQIKMSEVWNDNSLVPKTYTLAQFASIGGHFQFIFPSTLASTNPNTGAISFPNNESASNKTYEIELLVGHDGCPTNAPVRKKFTVTKLAKPAPQYGNITLTYTTKQAKSEYGNYVVITVTNLSQMANGTSVNYPVSTLTDLIALDWDHTTYPWVVSMNKNMNSGNLEINTTVRANESSASRDFVANISFTLNGKPYSRGITVTQDTDQWLNKVWYGYSDHTPTSFEDRLVAAVSGGLPSSNTSTAASGGTYTVNTLNNAIDVKAYCHYLILPENSPYNVTSVKDDDNDAIDVEYEDNLLGADGKRYKMWHRTESMVIWGKANFKL